MCGITGIISKNKVSETALRLSVATLSHRGPDGNGIYLSENGKAGLGHSRLSFIELSEAGQQPFSTHGRRRLTITYNGEVYNFLELKAQLEALGMVFQTRTDTEVLLKAYEAWGEDMLSKLKGMFAFAIYDAGSNKLFAARDRFGIKPFYYAPSDRSFTFGSEIKALFSFPEVPRKIRKASVATFLANRYVPTPHTIWEGIFQLPPAHSITVDTESLEFKLHPYWTLPIGRKNGNEAAVRQEIRELLKKSVSQHLISDVQVGTFLSGGMDSSLLALLMKELKYDPIDSFTIGFKGWEQSEHRYAEKVAKSLEIRLHAQLEDSFTLDSVSRLMYHYDNPIADISILPTFAVSRLARNTVKAVLSGEGADECFGGYWWQKPAQFTWRSKFQKWQAGIFGTRFQQIKEHYIHAASMGLFDADELRKAFTDDWQDAVPEDPFAHIDAFRRKGISTLKQLQYLDLKLFMPELVLAKIDRATMANSLEARVPFLDHELVEKLFSLDETLYFDEAVQKKVLRHFLKGNVPEEIYDRRKQGFVGPDSFYENIAVYREKLSEGRLVKDGVIKSSYIQKLIQENDYWRLWKLFVLENWWEVWY